MPHIKTLKLLSLILISVISNNIYGQGKLDLASINFSVTPSANLDKIPTGIPGLEDFGIGTNEFEIRFMVPVPLSEKLILTLEPYYELTSFSYENGDAFIDDFRTDKIHKIQLGTNLTWLMNDVWSITLFNSPNLSSDFRESSFGDDFFNQPGILANKRVNEKFSYGFGIVGSFVFGERQIFPILTLKYLSENKKLFTDVTFPNARLAYSLSDKFEAGFMIKLRGNQYNYKNLPVAGSAVSTDFIKFSNVLMGPELTYNMTDMLGVRVSAGVNTNRKYEIFDTNGDNLGDITPKDSGFFNFGLVFRVPTE